MNHHIRW